MKRAADFQEGFMGVPGYSDDSLLSVVRYVSQVQVSLDLILFPVFIVLAHFDQARGCTIN